MAYSLEAYATNCLRPFDNDFWRWSDDGTVIEWFDGQTIAFREEILDILQYTEADGFAPFGLIVLTLAACQENWKADERVTYLKNLISPPDKLVESMTKQYIRTSLEFMEGAIATMHTIRQLPAELRRGTAKTHLVRHQVIMGDTFKEATKHAMPMIIDLQYGRTTDIVRPCGRNVDPKVLDSIIAQLYNARHDTAETMEAELRTGIKKLVPADTIPEALPANLMDELQASPETGGIARLTKHLVAALKIPMHTFAPAEQLPTGGVSDITNRGSFDKLLLTELAQDDAMLTARLVNNEALYLRREEPPDKTPRHQILLIDTTLRMWGIPRVFAASVALAYIQKAEADTTFDVYALSGNGFEVLDLTTKQGVLSALEKMDTAFDCIDGLDRFFEQPHVPRADYILITDAESIIQPEMQLALSQHNKDLKCLITVSRHGELTMFEYHQGNRSLATTATLAVNDILTPVETNGNNSHTPAFLTRTPSPLRFALPDSTYSYSASFFKHEIGLLNVTRNNRVLFWTEKGIGAIEVLHNIESGTYHFGHTDNQTVFLLTTNQSVRQTVLYTLKFELTITTTRDVFTGLVHTVSFYEGCFYLGNNKEILRLDPLTKTTEVVSAAPQAQVKSPQDSREWSPRYNYSVLQRVNTMFLTEKGKFILGLNELTLGLDRELRLVRASMAKPGPNDLVPTAPKLLSLTDNSRIRFQRFAWPNGSVALLDSRGLLHLKSVNRSIPEITIVLASETETAAWASDGARCGPAYFLGAKQGNDIDTAEFFKNYIQRFLSNLL